MHPGLLVLRKLLRTMRPDKQDGYHDVGPNGRFTGHARFISCGLPQATPEDLDALFELAGIRPDPIIPNGRCEDCVHSSGGQSRGWGVPCISCSAPKMTLFKLRRKNTKPQPEKTQWAEACGCAECRRKWPNATRSKP